jgi:hypothetical protein
MECRSCGIVLPVGAAYCPTCGAMTPYNVSTSGISPYDLTAASSPSGASTQAPPTDYGSPPYGVPPQNPYEPLNPYAVPLQAPLPPPTSTRRRIKIGLISGVVVLVLIIASVSVVALLTQRLKNIPTGNTSLPTATPAQTSIPATGTAHAEKNPYPPYGGTLVLNDPLRDNSKGYGWDEGTSSDGSVCKFIGGGYRVKQTDPRHFQQCVAEATDFSNFTFEVQMTIIKGGGGGITFRVGNASGNFYYLRILRSGDYILNFFDASHSTSQMLASGSSSAIKTGLNQTNVIAVVANSSTFDFYVNDQEIDRVSDNTFSHGGIGVTADYAPAEVVYSNAKVWM